VRVAYLDCFSGISGDMTLGALVDAGVPLDVVREAVAALELDGWDLALDPDGRDFRIGGTRVLVHASEDGGVHRTFRDIRGMIEAADLPAGVAERSIAVFAALAEAEGKVHGRPPDEVHFHEVGAVDSIVDIVGSVAGLAHLGIDRLVCSPLPLGGGTVHCRHGEIPIPAPATVELLRGLPTVPGHEQRELVTPTGAALARTLADDFGPPPPMVLQAVGYGLGSARGEGLPNALRLLLGDGHPADELPRHRATVLEANVDDLSPQFLGPLIERLLDAGALDASFTPVQMKKGRPGILVSVLCSPADRAILEELLFRETTTIGVRHHEVWRTCLDRRTETVQTPYGPIRLKVSGVGDRDLNRMPEFEDCREAALTHGVTPLEVHQAALTADRAGGGKDG